MHLSIILAVDIVQYEVNGLPKFPSNARFSVHSVHQVLPWAYKKAFPCTNEWLWYVCMLCSGVWIAGWDICFVSSLCAQCGITDKGPFSVDTCRTQQSWFDCLAGMLTQHAPDINMAKVSGQSVFQPVAPTLLSQVRWGFWPWGHRTSWTSKGWTSRCFG